MDKSDKKLHTEIIKRVARMYENGVDNREISRQTGLSVKEVDELLGSMGYNIAR